jgi:hypothetical protein
VHKQVWRNCNVDMKRPTPMLESLNALNLYILVESPPTVLMANVQRLQAQQI